MYLDPTVEDLAATDFSLWSLHTCKINKEKKLILLSKTKK